MYRIIFILILFQQIILLAQDHGNKDNYEKTLEKTIIEFKWSNDFVYETDYYYTNGFAFEVLGPWAKPNPINIVLIPSPEKSVTQFGITLIQDIFTPQERFDVEKQIDGDRPFAAYLLVGFIKKSYDPRKNIEVLSELQIGVLGPAALGKETQDGIHDLLPTSERLNGWENQISNSLAINYTCEFYKSFFEIGWFEFSGAAKGKLGIPFTQVELGGIVRLGYFDSYPNGFEMFSIRKRNAYLFAEVFGKAVGYN
ncbi:MAG: lipid A deacylase LpxR family protein, partial [Bacteroidales bacterium]|nr:lipid A deacylase LpxR family protein [Bacteroidales bacterium]